MTSSWFSPSYFYHHFLCHYEHQHFLLTKSLPINYFTSRNICAFAYPPWQTILSFSAGLYWVNIRSVSSSTHRLLFRGGRGVTPWDKAARYTHGGATFPGRGHEDQACWFTYEQSTYSVHDGSCEVSTTIWAPSQYKDRVSSYGDSHVKKTTAVRPSYL